MYNDPFEQQNILRPGWWKMCFSYSFIEKINDEKNPNMNLDMHHKVLIQNGLYMHIKYILGH